MADLSQYGFALEPWATIAGTVTAVGDWVIANGSVSISPDMYAYGRVDEDGVLIAPNSPGFVVVPFLGPALIARLPNPPYGAKIISEDNATAPNAMTELDATYIGVEADADYPWVGKYLYSQARSQLLDGSFELGVSGYSDELAYLSLPFWELAPLSNDPDESNWRRSEPRELTMPADDMPMAVISRGPYTYLALNGSGYPPGLVVHFNTRWWNGSGYPCGGGSMAIGAGDRGVIRESSTVVGGAEPGRTMSKAELVALFTHREWPDPNLAAAVSLAESGGDPSAMNTANIDGSIDYGLMQINSIHGFDPAVLMTVSGNIDAGFEVSSGGVDFTPWVTFNSGAYLDFL